MELNIVQCVELSKRMPHLDTLLRAMRLAVMWTSEFASGIACSSCGRTPNIENDWYLHQYVAFAVFTVFWQNSIVPTQAKWRYNVSISHGLISHWWMSVDYAYEIPSHFARSHATSLIAINNDSHVNRISDESVANLCTLFSRALQIAFCVSVRDDLISRLICSSLVLLRETSKYERVRVPDKRGVSNDDFNESIFEHTNSREFFPWALNTA